MSVLLGIEVFLEKHLQRVKGKKIGVVGNHSSIDRKGVHLVEHLQNVVKKIVCFGPEHGFSGLVEDQKKVSTTMKHSMMIYSLFGEFHSPTPKQIKNLDLLIFDIADVGVRFYTFISTLYYVLQSARSENKKVIILDRPNPISCSEECIEGPLSPPSGCGFFSAVPLPIRHSLTIGEIGTMFNAVSFGTFPALGCDLEIIKMRNYRREMFHPQTGLGAFKPTSPCMQTFAQTVVYPGFCLFEGTNVSEGRGTKSPFLIIGAPWMSRECPINWKECPEEFLRGLSVKTVEFTPESVSEATKPKYLNEKCNGIELEVLGVEEEDKEQVGVGVGEDSFSFREVRSVRLALWILVHLSRKYSEHFRVLEFMDKLWGKEDLRAMLSEGCEFEDVVKKMEFGIQHFKRIRRKCLLYK